MSTINFYLKQPDRKEACPIMLVYQNKGGKFSYYTKQKIAEKSWNTEKQRVKINYTGASQINTILDDLENLLKEIAREAIFQKKEIPLEVVRRKFNMKIGDLSIEGDFFKLFNKFIEEANGIKSRTTILSYIGTRNRLLEFKESKKVNITYETITTPFYDKLVNFLIKDKKLLNNSVGKHIKVLKVFLNWSINNEYTNPNISLKNFKVFKEDVDIIYLTEKELLKIYYLTEISEKLIEVKDNFCFGCFTGLRFSDIVKLNYTNIKDEFIELKTEKTKDSIKVPLNNYAKAILNKYHLKIPNRPIPKSISNQKTNQYLKEISRLAGIDDPIEVEKFNGSTKLLINKPKYEFVTTHTARRTFVTLSLEKGMRPESVMAITGHKKYDTFKKYIKITDTVKQIEMIKAWDKIQLRVV